MFVIAAPEFSLTRVMWYSDGPGNAWNCHPKSEPQNAWDFAVSSAGISMCTIWPSMRVLLLFVVGGSPRASPQSLHQTRPLRETHRFKTAAAPGLVRLAVFGLQGDSRRCRTLGTFV